MLVKILTLLILSGCHALPNVHVSLELNLTSDPSVASSELEFDNSRVFTYDVNPGYYIDRVTHSGLTVWKSKKQGQRVTNALLIQNDLGPRLINLTLVSNDRKSQLLFFLYTVNGWVDLTNVNPLNLSLVLDESEAASPLNKVNGEVYFAKKALTEGEEEPVGDRPVVLDVQNTIDNKFNYRFNYKSGKYIYHFAPKNGFQVKLVTEGDRNLWSPTNDQVVTEVTVEKELDGSKTVLVNYMDSEVPEEVLLVKKDGAWSIVSEDEAGDSSPNGPAPLGDALKPVPRTTRFDYSAIPDATLCRRCSYEIEGIAHNIVYFNVATNFRTFYDGDMLVYKVPEGLRTTGSCFYTKNETILFVDILALDEDKMVYFYFEKTPLGYNKISRDEFKTKLKSYKLIPVVIDITKENPGYKVATNRKGEINYKVMTPASGYVVQSVVDGDMKIFETSTEILEVTVADLGSDSVVLNLLYQNGPFFSYAYFTYSNELRKWMPISQKLYYDVIDEYSTNVLIKRPVLDITSYRWNNYVHLSKNETLHHYTFNPKPGVLLSAVKDSGRIVWTPKSETEVCAFVWYEYLNNLLYIVTNEKRTVRHYIYEKSSDWWTYIGDEEFKRRFSFIYDKGVTADISLDLSSRFIVKENGNSFYIKPKYGSLVTRVRYGDKLIWAGSDKLKCSSILLIYGKLETYLRLNLIDSEYRPQVQYYKTVSGDLSRWRACDSAEDCNDPEDLSVTSPNADAPAPSLNSPLHMFDSEPAVRPKTSRRLRPGQGSASVEGTSAKEDTLMLTYEPRLPLTVERKLALTNVPHDKSEPNSAPSSAKTAGANGASTGASKSDAQPSTSSDTLADSSKLNSSVLEHKAELVYANALNQAYATLDSEKSSLVTDSNKEASGPVSLGKLYKEAFEKDDQPPSSPEDTFLEDKAKAGPPGLILSGTPPNSGAKDQDKSLSQLYKQAFEKDAEENKPIGQLYKEAFDKDAEDSKTIGQLYKEAFDKDAEDSKTIGQLYKEAFDKDAEENKSLPELYKEAFEKDDQPPSKPGDTFLEDKAKAGPPGLTLSSTKSTSVSNVKDADNNKPIGQLYKEAFDKDAEDSKSLRDLYKEAFEKDAEENKSLRDLYKDAFEKDDQPPSSPEDTFLEDKAKAGPPTLTFLSTGKKSYAGGVLHLQDMRSTDYAEFRDAREFGFNYLVFTTRPGFPLRDLRDGFETIWDSKKDECLAFSVFLAGGFPKLLELFVRCNTEVVRKHFELSDHRWRPVTPERFDLLTAKN